MQGLGDIVASNVRGHACQVVAELVAATVDRAYDCLRESCAVERQMSERDDIVITTMVEEEPRNKGKPLSNVARQFEVVEVPTILIP